MTIVLKDVGSGFKRTAINENFDTIKAELNTNMLSKLGGVGLEADLDFNSQKGINLESGVLNSDAVNVGQLSGAIAAAGSGLIASQREVQTGAQVASDITTFTGITYTIAGNNLYVFRNGAFQNNGVDYTETSSSSITWLVTPNSTDDLVFITNIATTNSTTTTAAVTHTQYATDYNLATYLENRHIVSVLDFGVDPTGATDDTALWVLAEAAAEGKTLFIPKGTYLKNRTFPKSNTTFWFEPGCVINGTTGGNNTWRISNVDNVHFHFNGATINRDSSGTSANFYFSVARDCSVRDGHFVGGGAAKDCIYVGGGAVGTYSERILISGGSCLNANRNGISVVSAHDTIIERMEISGTTGGPGAGIDLEANNYDMCLRTVVRNCHIHNNAQNGIGCVFADYAELYGNYIHDNGSSGIGTAAGGTQFDGTGWGGAADVARANDVRGVGGFDTATGTISATSVSQDSAVGLSVGDVIIFNLEAGAALPAELQTQVRWTVTEVSASGNNAIKVGTAHEYGQINTFTGAGSGTLTFDPSTSDIRMLCYSQEGQNSNFLIYNNVFENNGGTSNPEISVSTGLNYKVYNNVIRSGLDKSLTIRNQYSVNVDVYDNYVYMDRSSTASGIGINFGQCSSISTRRNKVFNSTAEGIKVAGCSRGRFLEDELINCGTGFNKAMNVQLGSGAVVSPIIRQDTKNTPTYGLVMTASATNCVVQNADCTTAGNSNANSILISGTGTIVINSRQNDGSFRP